MEIGVALPQYGRHASPDAISRVAREAEAMGYASLWTGERLLVPTNPRNGYGGSGMPWPDSYRTFYDPLLTLTLAAAHTRRVRLGTSVLDALFHAPVVLGKQLATLDHISGGRLLVGLGQGWSEDEFAAVNVPPQRRGAGMQEWLEALLACWGPDPVRYQGRFYTIPEAEVRPKPVQAPQQMLMIGAFSEAGMERGARLGLGFNPSVFSVGQITATLEGYRAVMRAAGHDPDRAPIAVRANGPFTLEHLEGRRRAVSGSPEQVVADLGELEQRGVPHLFLDLNQDEMPVNDQLRYLERLQTLL